MRTIKIAAGVVLFVVAAYGLATAIKDAVLSMRFGGPMGGTAGIESFGMALVELGLVLLLFLLGALSTREHLERKVPRTIMAIVAALMVVWGIAAAYLE